MGNIITPAPISKTAKLKSIINTLSDQTRKIKTYKRQCVTRIKSLNNRMKKHMQKKKVNVSYITDCCTDDNIREHAEDISHEQKKIHDLKICLDTLRSLQYKVQTILNAYFTHSTLQTVNNAIHKSNISTNKQIEQDKGNIVSNFVYLKIII